MNQKQTRTDPNPERGPVAAPESAPAPEAAETFAMAVRDHRAGRLRQAEASYRSVIQARPDHYKAHSNLGVALQGQGKLVEAVGVYERAIELEPDNAGAHNNLGNAFKDLGRLDQAVASYRQAIALKPDYAGAYNNLGNALDDQGVGEEAVACYRKAIALDPNFAEAHNNLGSALKHHGSGKEAAACFQKAIGIVPDYIGAHYNYAAIHKFFPGDPAIEELQELLKQPNRSAGESNQLLFALGKAHDDIGRYADAFSYYSRANDEMAAVLTFDASRHRQEMAEIKEVYREPPDSGGESSGDVDHVPVFVVGVSRSGKTLVESLLSQHGDVHGAGESLEWINAVEAVFDRYSIPQPWLESKSVLTEDRIREIGRIYMTKIVKTSPDSKLIINTAQGNYRFIGMIFQGLPAAKIIYCHRDPTDNCLFVYFTRYAYRNKHSYKLENVASYIVNYQELMAHWQRLYGDRILGVRYEDLVRNPATVSARIYRFCGLDYDPAAVRHAFTTDEIGLWRHYEPHLDPLRRALGDMAQQSEQPQNNHA